MTQRLPAPVRARLADTRRHASALQAALGAATVEEFVTAARSGQADSLIRVVYPLERAFEILENYVIELAKLGLSLANVVPEQSGAKALGQLESEGVIGSGRRGKLVGIHDTRNRMQHDYPDVRAKAVYEAAGALLDELGPFFRDYANWLRRLGYG